MEIDEARQILVEQLKLVPAAIWDKALAKNQVPTTASTVEKICDQLKNKWLPVGSAKRPAVSEFQKSRLINANDRGRSLVLNGGQYVLIDQPTAWKGGGGTVFLALERLAGQSDRIVAIKCVRTPDANSIIEKRLSREIEFLCDESKRHLSGSNHVVRGINHFVEGAQTWLVMEYRQGKTVQEVVDELTAAGKRLTVRQTLLMTDAVLNGLDFLHQNNCVHRDIKPKNLIYERHKDGGDPYFVCIVDLGIVKILDDPITQDGMITGTLYYMAPECFGSADSTDERSDLYSLAAAIYFMLTGEPPAFTMFLNARSRRWPQFVHNDLTTWSHTSPDWSRLRLDIVRSDVPKPLADLVFRCLDPKRDQRPANVTEFRNELAEIRGAAEDVRSIHRKFPGFRNGLIQAIRAVFEEIDAGLYPVDRNALSFEKEVIVQLNRLQNDFRISQIVPGADSYNARVDEVKSMLEESVHSIVTNVSNLRNDAGNQRTAFEKGLDRFRQLQPELLALQHQLHSTTGGFV